MKLYQIRKILSRDTAEAVMGYVVPLVLVADIRAGLYFFAMVGGAKLSGLDLALAVFFAVQIAACAVGMVWAAVRFLKECRAPKRYGVIPPAEIRRILEGRRCIPKDTR